MQACIVVERKKMYVWMEGGKIEAEWEISGDQGGTKIS
jgi:hypothetical protein